VSRARHPRPVHPTRPRGWFDDPLVESELDPPELAGPRPELPTVLDTRASRILYDADERPLRRHIGFRPPTGRSD